MLRKAFTANKSLAPPAADNDPRRSSGSLAPPASGDSRRASSSPRLSIIPQATGSSRGPTLIGLLASKRLAKQLSTRVMRRRYGSLFGGRAALPVVQKEPSYRMEPRRKFNPELVEACIKEVLIDRMARFRYNPKFCANMCKILGDEIKNRVKLLNFDRYKLVCHVLICQRRDQGLHVSSRSAWDEKLDNFASYTFKNEAVVCTGTVFGVYAE